MNLRLLGGLCLQSISATTVAATVTISAELDNTIYSEGALSNGAGDHLFVGATLDGFWISTDGILIKLLNY